MNMLNSKIIKKIKSPFIIYADFENILVSDNNEKQYPEEPCTNKFQKHISFSHGYKLVCVDDKFSKSFNTYSGKEAIYDFINSMIEESKYVMKKHFNKELVIIIKGNGTFENSTKYWICDNDYIDTDVKVRDHCCVTGKYRGSAHRDCNIILRKLCASL